MHVHVGRAPVEGEYGRGTLYRFLLMLLLFVIYNLTPYVLPAATLWLVVGALLAYDARLWLRGDVALALLILLAAGLNAVMVAAIDRPGLNTFLAVVVFVILFWDVVCLPQKVRAVRGKK